MTYKNRTILRTNQDVIDFLKTQPPEGQCYIDLNPVNGGTFEHLIVNFDCDGFMSFHTTVNSED